MAGTQTGGLIRDSYATKLTLSLLGVVGLATAAGVLVYFQARSLFGADAGVIGSSILGLILITVISLAQRSCTKVNHNASLGRTADKSQQRKRKLRRVAIPYQSAPLSACHIYYT